MNRLKRELTKRGMIYEADELNIVLHGAEYDVDAQLVTITPTVIVIAEYSAVMPARFVLYDRFTFEFIASQDMYLDGNPAFIGTGKMNPWDITLPYEAEPYPWEEDEWTEEDEAAKAWAYGVAPNPEEDIEQFI